MRLGAPTLSTTKGSTGSRSLPAPTTSPDTPASPARLGPASRSARTGGDRTTWRRASRLEYLDLAGPVLKEPVRIEDGHAVIATSPGTGVEWDEESVRRYLVD